MSDYPGVNQVAVKEMHRQVGGLVLDERGGAPGFFAGRRNGKPGTHRMVADRDGDEHLHLVLGVRFLARCPTDVEDMLGRVDNCRFSTCV